MTEIKRERRVHLTKEQIKKVREEYCNNPQSTIEFLADKYGISRSSMALIISNKSYHDPLYKNPKRKSVGTKKAIYLPDHLLELKDFKTPAPTTSHRARGQNRTINRFK